MQKVEIDREVEREGEKEKETERHKERQRERQREREKDKETERKSERQIEIQRDSVSERQIEKFINISAIQAITYSNYFILIESHKCCLCWFINNMHKHISYRLLLIINHARRRL